MPTFGRPRHTGCGRPAAVEPANRSFASVYDVATREGAVVPFPRWTDEQLRAALADPAVTSLADVCRALGLVPRGANYATLRAAASRLGLDLDALRADRATPARPGHRRRSYTDERLLAALDDPDVDSYPQLCHALGLRPNSTTYRRLREHAAELGATVPASWSRRGTRPGTRSATGRVGPRSHPVEPLLEALQDARYLADVIRRLGEEPNARAYARLARSFAEHGIEPPPMDPNVAGAARRTTPLDELLVRGRHRNSSRLRARLLRERLLPRACAGCGGTRWRGDPIPLELDHIDGGPHQQPTGEPATAVSELSRPDPHVPGPQHRPTPARHHRCVGCDHDAGVAQRQRRLP